MKPAVQTSPAPTTKQAKKIKYGYHRGVNQDKLFRIWSLVVFLTKAGDFLTKRQVVDIKVAHEPQSGALRNIHIRETFTHWVVERLTPSFRYDLGCLLNWKRRMSSSGSKTIKTKINPKLVKSSLQRTHPQQNHQQIINEPRTVTDFPERFVYTNFVIPRLLLPFPSLRSWVKTAWKNLEHSKEGKDGEKWR